MPYSTYFMYTHKHGISQVLYIGDFVSWMVENWVYNNMIGTNF